jgi:rifampicin phosphotransferase
VSCQHEDADTGRAPPRAHGDISSGAAAARGQAGEEGGKGAHLRALARLDGVRVPEWFCVTTAAYRRTVAEAPPIRSLVGALATVEPRDAASSRELTARIRQEIERIGVPHGLAEAIRAEVERIGGSAGYAVRSSATAEDLPSASFAGQHDSYLNVVGLPTILRAVSRCWGSLFSDRAVAYRVRNGIDHHQVEMAVVVQRMVLPRASGVLFTADPVSGNRNVTAVEATHGLGDALVSGAAQADTYRVRDGRIVERATAVKHTVVVPSPGGGTDTVPVAAAQQTRPALTDGQVLELVALGRRIAAELDRPQDVEWCLDDEGIHVVQARPITTLFPVPATSGTTNRVYVSVGHQQMMTDPMTPLGLSVWQLTSPAPMQVAGGRLFVDVTGALSAPATRARTLDTLGRSDPLIRDALETILERGDLVPNGAGDVDGEVPTSGDGRPEPSTLDPSVVAGLVEQHRASVVELQDAIRSRSGSALFEFILADLQDLRALLFDPRSHQALMAGFEAAWWLDENLAEWLGEHRPSDVLSLAAPDNVTAEMGLALLDVADAVRPHPAVLEALRSVGSDDDLAGLAAVEGGGPALEAIGAYLDAYGVRCVGEIDIARPRWSERPAALVPIILSNVASFTPGERERRLEQGREKARREAQELLDRLRRLPGGAEKAERTERMIARLRRFVGYREYPKFAMVSRYAHYRQALLAEAEGLVTDEVLHAVDDTYYLSFAEFHEVVRTGHADHDLIGRRRAEFRAFAGLTPPRVLTSEGEALDGAYRRDDLPAGALVGLPVSSGVVEGRARVLRDVGEADLEPGDILVTPHTDPSWSPLFVTVAGLVTEVGGLLTHGAVVAREYGLPAVVGVERATERIRDGQRIRVDGTRGFVEMLQGPEPASQRAVRSGSGGSATTCSAAGRPRVASQRR